MAEVAFRDYLGEIDQLIERGSTDQAIQHCRHILTQHPKAVEVYRLLGKALLEKEEDRAAQDIFQRVLSVDPEDFVARIGLSIIHDRNNELEAAIWHLERAFEIAPSNPLIQGELRRLYARRDDASPERIPVTRGALARMYAAGDLNAESIADLRQLLSEQADRIDLQVQLAEVLWRDEQSVEAAERSQQITTTLPYCLKANLILGAILHANGAKADSDEPLQRAQAADPENRYAQRLFSGMGPLYQQAIMVDRLELLTIDQMLEAPLPLAEAEEVPEWLRGLSDVEQPLREEPESMQAAGLPSGSHMPEVATEIPDWLRGLTGETTAPAEAAVPDWLAALTGAAAAGVAVEALSDHERKPEEAAAVRPADEAVPDWITQLGQTGKLTAEELPAPEEEPDWMAQLREAPPAPFSEQIPASEDTETPDWLAQLRASEPTLEREPAVAEEPDWLSQLRAPGGEAETGKEAEPGLGLGAAAAGLAGAALYAAHETGKEEVEPASDRVQPIDLAQPSELPAAETEQPPSSGVPAAATEPEIPEEMPSAEDALAFLAKLAAGKEDQLRTQAQAEADVRMAEIMGRKPAEHASAVQEEHAPIKMSVAAATVAAVAAGLAAKTTQEERPAEPQAPPAVSAEVSSADQAQAFVAKPVEGEEDQLRAEAEREAEARMAEIIEPGPGEPQPPESAPGEKPAVGLAAAALGAAALAAGAAATQKEEQPPAEIPEEMPSSDEALAFLSRLTAGKEDELRAQAEQEAEARMAAIMGRRASREAAKPEGEPPGLPAAIEPETEPVAEAETPDWLTTMRLTEEAATETPESEFPEWLRAMRPAEDSSELSLAALLEEEARPVDELPDWLRTQQPVETAGEEPGEVEGESSTQDLLAGLAALQRAAAQVEAPSAAQPTPLQISALLSTDWWIQTAADTGEEPLPELPQPYLSPRARAAEKEKVAAAVPAEVKLPQERRVPQTGPLRQTGPLGLPQTGPLGTPEPAAALAEVETLLSRVHRDEQDYAARLDLARTYWATGNREGAYTEYLALVNVGEYPKETMADLETIVEIHDQTDWHRMLGDVYMKAGRLSGALDHYRRALSEV